jgi:urease accessory protein
MDTTSLSRLLQLASPALPVGAYSYSQGLEWAVHAGTVRDEAGAARWIGDALHFVVGSFEAPLLARMLDAWRAADAAELAELNILFVASRETAELRAETLQMGYSLARLLDELDGFPTAPLALLAEIDEPAFPTVWSCVAAIWDIDTEHAVTAYLWSWCENQVMAALKAVPLGQAAGQRLLLRLGSALPAIVVRALAGGEDQLSNIAPGLTLASSCHETQYSRLFRS